MSKMKRLFIITMMFLAMGFTTNVFAAPTTGAADRLAKQATLITELRAITVEYKALDQDEAKLGQRWKDLEWGRAEIDKAVNKYMADDTQWKIDAAAYERDVTNHNSRCSGTFSDQNYVNACNAAADQGAAHKQELIQRSQHLDKMKELIIENERVNAEETQKIFTQHKSNEARMNELAAKHAVLLAQLKQIEAEVDNCTKTITGATMERMHDVCGMMFDGNK